MSTVEYDPLTGLPKKKTAASGAAPAALTAAGGQTFSPWSFYMPQAAGVQPPGTIKLPGYTPDYTALINAALGPLQAQLAAEGVQDLSGRNQQIVRALGQFGEPLSLESANQAFGSDFVNQAGLGELLGQANQLAEQTTGAGLSVTARLEKAHKDAVRQIRNSLAARGLLRSGELGHQLQEQQGAFDTGQYDARQQLFDFLSAVQSGYVQAQRARQQQLTQAQMAEAARQAELNPATGERTAVHVGGGYYRLPDGSYVDADGNPTGPPPVVPPRDPKRPPAGGGGGSVFMVD